MNYRSLRPTNAGVISYHSASMADHILGVKGNTDLNGYPHVIYLHRLRLLHHKGSLAGGSGGGGYSPMTGAVLTIKDEFTALEYQLTPVRAQSLVSCSAGEIHRWLAIL